MPETIFWDVDTQYDFIMPDGKLYIREAEKILPNLERLTACARQRNIPVFGSVDYHNPGDPEISDSPDLHETFPPHCLKGTPGQQKVPETRPANPMWIDGDPEDPVALAQRIRSHTGEVMFRKQRFDVFTNRNVDPVLDVVRPGRIVLYGVALDVCNAHAINGFLERNTAPIQLVLDATQAISPEHGDALVACWKDLGVTVVSTDDVTR